jgi:hypothetical protein
MMQALYQKLSSNGDSLMESNNLPQYTKSDLESIHKIILPHLPLPTYAEEYTCLEDFKRHPITYHILSAPLDVVPLYLCSEHQHVVEIVSWRLQHNK